MADKSVPLIKTTQAEALIKKGEKVVFLDAREIEEYKVSHIKEAKHVGYDKFSLDVVKDIPKNKVIIVYCSVGYRSGKIGAQLREAGYTSVFNLYGGIFDWANNGSDIYEENKKATKVHPYNANWGKWLKPELRN